jgi:hypothetical protein
MRNDELRTVSCPWSVVSRSLLAGDPAKREQTTDHGQLTTDNISFIVLHSSFIISYG